jgi:hypothetical protein
MRTMPPTTPQISGVVKENGDYVLSILKSNMGKPSACAISLNILQMPGSAISCTPIV